MGPREVHFIYLSFLSKILSIMMLGTLPMENHLETRKILSYDDVVGFVAGKSDEPLIDIRKYDQSITTKYIKQDMLDYTGDIIYIRDTLAKKLAKIETELSKVGYKLNIAYGYRHPEVQAKYFNTRRQVVRSKNPTLSDQDIDKLTHSFVAIPSVAGHPAGAAVDLTITDSDGTPIDMGTAIADYSDPDKIITYAKGLTADQSEHRKLLHDLMIHEGFAPFYGEWWHFSYGDREWAAFYNKKALYGAVDFRLK
jgi:D-alanyl-D-alanine dipeptidase